MKRIGILLLAVLGFAVFHAPQLEPARAVAAEEKVLPDDAKFKGSVIEIPMRDGKSLAADVFVPKNAGKYPVILIQTPYNKNSLRVAFTGKGRYGPDVLFTDTNYAFVVTDWRGKFASKDAKGTGTPDLGKDGFDTCAWIAKQEWCNGKIGTWGPSALGKAQYETARANPPNLVCCVPMVMHLGLSYETVYPGGVLWEEFVRTLGKIGFGPTLYDQFTAHPTKDTLWNMAARTFVKGEDIRVPMLLIGGWYDIYPDGVPDAFDAIRSRGGDKARAHSKLIMGPWVHATDSKKVGALEFAKAENYGIKHAQAFFDYWMRDIANEFDTKQPTITYFQMGADEWRSTDVWPPKGSAERLYYLQPDRSLAPTPPTGEAKPATFAFDPAKPAPTVGGHLLSPDLHVRTAGPAREGRRARGRAGLQHAGPGERCHRRRQGPCEAARCVRSDRHRLHGHPHRRVSRWPLAPRCRGHPAHALPQLDGQGGSHEARRNLSGHHRAEQHRADVSKGPSHPRVDLIVEPSQVCGEPQRRRPDVQKGQRRGGEQ